MTWGCVGECWCPECQQVLDGNGCMCIPSCDLHPGKAVHGIPDGIHARRMYGSKQPHQHRFEYSNGWLIGRDDDKEGWVTFKPFHETLSPSELRWKNWVDERKAQDNLSPYVIRVDSKDSPYMEGAGI